MGQAPGQRRHSAPSVHGIGSHLGHVPGRCLGHGFHRHPPLHRLRHLGPRTSNLEGEGFDAVQRKGERGGECTTPMLHLAPLSLDTSQDMRSCSI